MIKKKTKAVFLDGEYKGEYDWKGAVPLSQGEIITLEINSKLFQYSLVKKEVLCKVEEGDQLVDISYTFQSI